MLKHCQLNILSVTKMEDDQFQKNVKEAMNSDSLIFFFKSGDKHCNKSKKE